MKIDKYISKIFLGCMFVLIALVTACSDDDKKDPILLPEATIIAPTEGLKPGDKVVISGANLDLVKEIRIGNAALVARAKFVSANDTKIEFLIPNKALSGDLYFVLTDNTRPNEKAGTLSILIPTIVDVKPLEIFPGDMITITGTDLDMITDVRIDSLSQKELNHVETTKLEAIFSYDLSKGGILKMKTINGQEISFATPIVVKKIPVVPTISNILPSKVRPGQTLVIRGRNLDQVKKITFEEDLNVTSFISQEENVVEVQVPTAVKKGISSIILETIYGDKAYANINVISGVDPVTNPALLIYDFEDGLLDYARWDGVGKATTANGDLGIYYEITSSTWYAGKYWLFAENHQTHASVTNKSNYWLKADICLRKDIPVSNSTLCIRLAGVEVNILPYMENVNGTHWSTKGDWKTIAISLSAWKALPDPTPAIGSDWGMTIWDNGTDFTGFCIDNIRYEEK